MPRERVCGRTAELGVLDKACKSAKPELIAIYGRRRVGKSSDNLFTIANCWLRRSLQRRTS